MVEDPGQRAFDLLDSETGCILQSEVFDCGGYGGLADCNGIVWSSHPHLDELQLLRFDPPTGAWSCTTVAGSYGLGIDSQGYIWNSSEEGEQRNIVKIYFLE